MPSRPVAVSAAAVLASAAVLGSLLVAGREPAPPPTAIAAVDRGPLRGILVERGELRPRRFVTLVSEIRSNRAKIVHLIPEGTFVHRSDRVVGFDPTPFEEEVRQLDAEIRQAEGALAEAVAGLGVVEAQGMLEVEAAEQRARMAALDTRNVVDGEGVIRVRESELAAREARRRAAEADAELADLEQMLEKGFVTKREVERARRAAEQAREEAELGAASHRTQLDVARPAEVERARSEQTRAREELEAVRAARAHRRERQEAAVAKAEGALLVLRDKRERVRGELDRCELLAPVDGFVVHEVMALGADRRKAQVGDTVWSGQAIATIPDAGALEVHARVRELDLHRVAPGQPARVTVEAYPDLVLPAQVARVGLLAASGEGRGEEPWSKSFHLVLDLDGVDERLRPGMSARVEITTFEDAAALRIPVQAVRWLDPGRARAFVVGARGEVEPHDVEVEEGDALHYRVLGGVGEGDRVLLDLPAPT